MATISDAKLTITHDHTKKLATPVVTCRVTFSSQEQALMRALPSTRIFKLRCELWGADSFLRGGDNHRFTYPDVFYFADSTPTPTESRTFTVVVGEGILDEDDGEDDIYGKVILDNLLFPAQFTKNTNQVHHSF